MKYDFSKVLTNADGSEASENGKPATARQGFVNALVADPQGLTPAEKAQRYALFVKLQNSADDLTVDELGLAKKAIEIYPTLVYGQLSAFLDQSN